MIRHVGVHRLNGKRWWGAALAVVLSISSLAILGGSGASAVVPSPGPNQAVLTVKVGGDRLPNGTVAGLQGVRLSLYGAGSGSSQPTPVTATQGIPGARLNAAWSWTTCVSDADGDCNFIIPIRAGAASATGVAAGTRFWVAQDAADVTAGWYSNPQARLGGFGATPEFTWGYRFRTPAINANTITRSTTPLGTTTDWNAVTEPDRGFMRVREDTNTEGGQGTNIGRTTGVWNQSRLNPPLSTDCGLKVALVTDTSGSLGPAGMIDVKAAMDTFVDGFAGTPTSMSVFSFSAVSPGGGASNHPALLPVSSAAEAAVFKAQYENWTSGGGTSWDRGLAAAANSGNDYDLVVLLTDGNPTVYGATPGAGSSAFNSFQDIDAGIFSANQLKAGGTRVVALGAGPAITAASSFNLRAVSGPTENVDYFRATDFTVAAQILADLAVANCQGSIQVQKMIVPVGGGISDAVPAPAGWQFAASTSATGLAVTPASATTPAGGLVSFGLNFTPPTTSGAVQILESQQAGYELLPSARPNATPPASTPRPALSWRSTTPAPPRPRASPFSGRTGCERCAPSTTASCRRRASPVSS